jgi:secreted trypsin-like serine protease
MKSYRERKLNQLTLVILICSAVLLGSCGEKKEASLSGNLELSDIVNGKSTTKKNENALSVVAIIAEKDEGQSLCTGTVIAPEIILTAAHCLDNVSPRLQIVFNFNISKAKEKDLREADKYIQHPHWGRHLKSGESDIALIHFKGALPDNYFPVVLANKSLKLKIGQNVSMLGYGVTNGRSYKGAGKLRETNSTILEQNSSTEFITDGVKSSVCYGDSGGPSFLKTGNSYVQWGVASSVLNKECNEASVHTGVMKYDAWIKSSIKKMKNG